MPIQASSSEVRAGLERLRKGLQEPTSLLETIGREAATALAVAAPVATSRLRGALQDYTIWREGNVWHIGIGSPGLLGDPGQPPAPGILKAFLDANPELKGWTHREGEHPEVLDAYRQRRESRKKIVQLERRARTLTKQREQAKRHERWQTRLGSFEGREPERKHKYWRYYMRELREFREENGAINWKAVDIDVQKSYLRSFPEFVAYHEVHGRHRGVNARAKRYVVREDKVEIIRHAGEINYRYSEQLLQRAMEMRERTPRPKTREGVIAQMRLYAVVREHYEQTQELRNYLLKLQKRWPKHLNWAIEKTNIVNKRIETVGKELEQWSQVLQPLAKAHAVRQGEYMTKLSSGEWVSKSLKFTFTRTRVKRIDTTTGQRVPWNLVRMQSGKPVYKRPSKAALTPEERHARYVAGGKMTAAKEAIRRTAKREEQIRVFGSMEAAQTFVKATQSLRRAEKRAERKTADSALAQSAAEQKAAVAQGVALVKTMQERKKPAKPKTSALAQSAGTTPKAKVPKTTLTPEQKQQRARQKLSRQILKELGPMPAAGTEAQLNWIKSYNTLIEERARGPT